MYRVNSVANSSLSVDRDITFGDITQPFRGRSFDLSVRQRDRLLYVAIEMEVELLV